MRYFASIITGLFLFSHAPGQLLPVYSQFHFHETLINPATTGSELYPVINLSYRKQWAGIPNSPTTQILSIHLRIAKYKFYTPKMMLNKGRFRAKERTGLGAVVFHDQNGPIHTSGLHLSYAYHIPFHIQNLSFGLALSFSDRRINYTMLNPTDPDDLLLLNQKDNVFILNSDAGVYYHSERYFLGLSVTELIPAWNKQNDPGYEYAPNAFFQAGYRFSLVRNLLYEPSIRVRKTIPKKMIFEFNSKFYYSNVHWAGLNIRTDRTLSAYLGINLRRYIYLAYIYEYSFGEIGGYFNNTHTIMLGQNIGIRSIPGLRKIKSW